MIPKKPKIGLVYSDGNKDTDGKRYFYRITTIYSSGAFSSVNCTKAGKTITKISS